MLTFRFENDARAGSAVSEIGDRHGAATAKSYICCSRGDHHEMILKHGEGERETFIIGSTDTVKTADSDHTWDRCYVMNEAGATVDKIMAPACAYRNPPLTEADISSAA